MTKFSFRIQQHGIKYSFEVESVYNSLLNEGYYIVTPAAGKRVYSPFLMVMDFDKGGLVLQGAAPYFVRELSEEISESIEHYHLGEGL